MNIAFKILLITIALAGLYFFLKDRKDKKDSLLNSNSGTTGGGSGNGGSNNSSSSNSNGGTTTCSKITQNEFDIRKTDWYNKLNSPNGKYDEQYYLNTYSVAARLNNPNATYADIIDFGIWEQAYREVVAEGYCL